MFDWLKKFRDRRREHVALVIQDGFLEVVQVDRHIGGLKLVGLNRVVLPQGVIRHGSIADESAFQQAVQRLFMEAAPHPVRADSLYVNIPFDQTYAFVKEFSKHTPLALTRKELIENVAEEVPFKMDELEWDFQGRSDSGRFYGLVAYPKLWQGAVREACGEMGFHDIHYMAEPVAQLGLSKRYLPGDFALLSKLRHTPYLSFFLDGLLYSTFALSSPLNDVKHIQAVFDEYQRHIKAFAEVTKHTVGSCSLVGFHQKFKNAISSSFELAGLDCRHLEDEGAPLADIVSPHDHTSTLIGLGTRTLLPRRN